MPIPVLYQRRFRRPWWRAALAHLRRAPPGGHTIQDVYEHLHAIDHFISRPIVEATLQAAARHQLIRRLRRGHYTARPPASRHLRADQ